MSEEDSAEKEHEPSQQKLDEARRRGEVPQGRDLYAAAAYGGLLLAGAGFGAAGLARAGGAGQTLLDQADRLAPMMFAGGAPVLGGLAGSVGAGLWSFLVLPMLAVAAMLATQRALVFAPEKLMPKLSRISPVTGAKNKFGRSGLFEFAKSFVKLIAVTAVLGLFLDARMNAIMATAHLGPGVAASVLMRLLLEFLALVLVLQAVIGAGDLIWQRHDHRRRNRMSRKELMDELKRSEGDPHVKAQRRRRGVEIATNRMLADVPGADVVIVNPTHYAVALKWDRASREPPVCVAKGVDEIAARIRDRATEAGVPLRHDPTTARALHATVEIGAPIRPEHYRAVAAAIRFAETMRKKAGEWR